MILLSFAEAAALVVILSIGLNQVRKRLITISEGLGTLGGALAMVETNHLRGLMQWVARHQRAAAGDRRRAPRHRREGGPRRAQGARRVGRHGRRPGTRDDRRDAHARRASRSLLLTRMFKTIRELRGVTTGSTTRCAGPSGRSPPSRAAWRPRSRGGGDLLVSRGRGARLRALVSCPASGGRRAAAGVDPAHAGLQTFAAGTRSRYVGPPPAARHRMHRPRLTTPIRAVPFALLAAVVAAWAIGAGPAGGQDRADSLRNSIQSKRDREARLSSAAARLGRLERATAREVAILERRVAAVKRDLDAAQALLDRTEQRRDAAMARALRLRARLAQSRGQLAKLLRERYTGGRPDLLTVVLEADGFASLLETVDFLKRIQRADQKVLAAVRTRAPRGRRPAARADAADGASASAPPTSCAGATTRSRRSPTACASGARRSTARGRRGSRRCTAAAAAGAAPSASSTSCSRRATARSARSARAARGRSRGSSSSASPAARTCRPTQAGGVGLLPVHHGRPGRASAARRRTPTRRPRPSRTGSRRRLWDGGRGASNWDCAALVGII